MAEELALKTTKRPRAAHRPVTETAKATFLSVLRQRANITAACRATPHARQTFYDLRERDPEFAEAWDEALEEAVDGLEQVAWERAVDGVAVYSKRDPETGVVTEERRDYSDRLLETLLVGNRRRKYGKHLLPDMPSGGSVRFTMTLIAPGEQPARQVIEHQADDDTSNKD
jgi:hypothetical protein